MSEVRDWRARPCGATLIAGLVVALCICCVVVGVPLEAAQTRRAPARRAPAPRPAAPAPAPLPAPPLIVTEPAAMACPQVLGEGVSTKRLFCEVVIGRDPTQGIRIGLPPHAGPVTLLFDLHNRHTYSEDLVKAGRAYHRYTATIGVLTLDNTLVSRAVVQSEFRSAAELVDRVSGGAGPGGLKAVAPTGTESIALTMDLPAGVVEIGVLGEKLSVIRTDGVDSFIAAGRPIALISNVKLSYRPPLPPPPPTTRRR